MLMRKLFIGLASIASLVFATPAHAAQRTLFYTDFNNSSQVTSWQTSPQSNDAVKVGQADNTDLQHPTLHSNVYTSGGYLYAWTRPGVYQTTHGAVRGETTARVKVGPTVDIRGGLVLQFRAKALGDGKSSQMFWPAGAYKWELDIVERFDGNSGESHRTHAEFGHSTPDVQNIADWPVDAYSFHTYTLGFVGASNAAPTAIAYYVDGHLEQVLNGGWVPNNPLKGFLTIGLAVPGPRNNADTHADAIVWDWAKITQN